MGSSTIHTEFWTLALFHQEITNSGSWLQFSRDGTRNTWQTGMSSDSSYVIRASDATHILSVSQNGDTTKSGNLEAQRLTLNKLSNDSDSPFKITNNNQNWEVIALESTIAGDGCFQVFKTAQSPTVWNTGIWNQSEYGIRYGVNGIWIYDTGDTTIGGNLNVSKTLNLTISTNGWFVGKYESTNNEVGVLFGYKTSASSTSWWQGVWGANTNEFNIWYNYQGLSLKSNGSAVLSGILDVGPSQAVTSIEAYGNHAGHQGDVEIKALWNSQGYVNFNTTNADGLLVIATKDVLYLYCGLNTI